VCASLHEVQQVQSRASEYEYGSLTLSAARLKMTVLICRRLYRKKAVLSCTTAVQPYRCFAVVRVISLHAGPLPCCEVHLDRGHCTRYSRYNTAVARAHRRGGASNGVNGRRPNSRPRRGGPLPFPTRCRGRGGARVSIVVEGARGTRETGGFEPLLLGAARLSVCTQATRSLSACCLPLRQTTVLNSGGGRLLTSTVDWSRCCA
jgi:hypothetical protein